ncbi:putative disease resistance RPP13-like protein 1 isoform X2 [Arachis stenosperma]|uniref:putative disease resistance RPP13-like protein 1 isoform X2 n=1 Tax=Arachis stenosperma TaxID=217475 RepID=UPI0025AC5F09|nr:putative disease resistance RPP13-like protein 1 isoform X2 [Arachis stenosperma]XP_057743117.1 putative disease resistance RPP13-like protein 1 isoform X2 [Arachis stenosperma]
MVTRIEDIIARLEDIAKHKDILRLEKIAAKNMSGRIPSTSLVKKSDIFVGRDKERDTIVKLLLDDANDGELSLIPIVGMGGIGKTTLAKLVYNDDKVKQKFHFMAWVCVAEEEFDVLKVTKAVTEKICSPCSSNDLDTVQNHLKKALAEKNFFVVLDDVWSSNRERWECFLTPFECGSVGGKILITTRLVTVASVVKTKHNQAQYLSLLDEEQCWSVFANRAWDPTESRDRSTLEEIGRKIVEKCKGLPLAAQTLGGLLRGKDNEKEWNDVLNSEFWELSEEDSGILPALRISYYHLPSYLKRCFVYCCLYPKDFEFDRNELTLLWMAEGLLLQHQSGNTLEEIGYEYFDDLVSRSFFQHSNSDDTTFVMHDLMHDLATFYGGKFFSSILKLKNKAKRDTKTRHLSCENDNDSVLMFMEACNRLKHVRTLLHLNLHEGGGRYRGAVPCDLLEHLMCLRVLSSNFVLDDENLLHGSIGKLIHLRYLDLSYTSIVTLPESLSCLYNLQTLKLRNCGRLKKLPSKLQNLVNLRHLDVSLTNLEEMPKKMSKLKELQFLSDYIVGKHEENGIGELGELAHLRESLCIRKLENVKNSGEASNARMDEKIHLNALYLIWSPCEESEVCDSHTEKDILDKFRPHKDLKELSIRRYRGTMFPDWVGQPSYHKITKLELRRCRNCWMLPSLGQLPALTRLEISRCNMVMKIGGEFYKADATHRHQEIPFRSLQYLKFYRMGCWEEWESYEYDEDDDAPFPKLETLVIKYCPKLRGDLPTFLPSLKTLEIRGCKELGCYLPRAPILRKLEIYGKQEARIRDLSLSLQLLRIDGNQLVESLFEAMTHTQPNLLVLKTSRSENLTSLEVSESQSLRELSIEGCPKLENITRLPACLRELSIRECGLLGEGIKRKDPRIWPSISHIPFIYVNGTTVRYDLTS